jgi:hypothetical protein
VTSDAASYRCDRLADDVEALLDRHGHAATRFLNQDTQHGPFGRKDSLFPNGPWFYGCSLGA